MSEPTVFDDHFRNPRNAGRLAGASGQVKVENPVCGDELLLYWNLAASGADDPDRSRAGCRIGEVRFQVYGCPAAIAAGSILTELVAGADRTRLAAIDAHQISTALGGLDSRSYHAATLAADGVRALIDRLPTADR